MMRPSTRTIVRYLLRELSSSAEASLERRYFADPRAFAKIVKTENDLIDEYARGRLSPRARERFERAYLADPRRRERAKFGEAFVTSLDRAARPDGAVEHPAGWRWSWALAAAMSLLIALGSAGWFALSRRTQQEQARDRAAQAER